MNAGRLSVRAAQLRNCQADALAQLDVQLSQRAVRALVRNDGLNLGEVGAPHHEVRAAGVDEHAAAKSELCFTRVSIHAPRDSARPSRVSGSGSASLTSPVERAGFFLGH